MPAEDKQWFRTYAVFYKSDPAMIESLEELIAELQNRRSISRSDAVKTIFDAGVEALAKDPEFGNPSLIMSMSEGRLLHAISLEAKRQEERAQALQFLGPLGILEVAGRLGIDEESAMQVLESCKRAAGQSGPLPTSHAYKLWIMEHLKDGEAHRYQEVVSAAEEDGLLPRQGDNEKEHERALSLLKNVASGMGVSGGKRGWWQLPQATETEEQDPF